MLIPTDIEGYYYDTDGARMVSSYFIAEYDDQPIIIDGKKYYLRDGGIDQKVGFTKYFSHIFPINAYFNDILPIISNKNDWLYSYRDVFCNLVYDNESCRIWVMSYYYNVNFLYLRDIVIPIFTDIDYVLFAEWGECNSPDQNKKLISNAKYPQNIFWMCNSDVETKFVRDQGIQAFTVSHNAFIDPNTFTIQSQSKMYDSIYVATIRPQKRHYLSKNLKNILYVADISNNIDINENLSPYRAGVIFNVYPRSVVELINKSKCGLMLSNSEGGCYASTEYLYCGIPVVSTRNVGGRNAYYDDYNCLFCEDTADDVENKVNQMTLLNRDPQKIRDNAIECSRKMLDTLKNSIIRNILIKCNDPQSNDIDNFFNMLLNKYDNKSSKGRTIFQPERPTHNSIEKILSVVNKCRDPSKPPRNIYLDLGAFQGDTLQMFRQNGVPTRCHKNVDWEVFSFEACPLLAHNTQLHVDKLNNNSVDAPVTHSEIPGMQTAVERSYKENLPFDNNLRIMFEQYEKLIVSRTSSLGSYKDKNISNEEIKILLKTAKTPLPFSGTKYTAYAMAVGNKNTTLEMRWAYSNYMNGGGNLLNIDYGAPSHVFTVPVIRLSDWIKDCFTKNDYLYIKMDIEGMEFLLVEDLIATGCLCIIKEMDIEWHGRFNVPGREREKELRRIIAEAGIILRDHY